MMIVRMRAVALGVVVGVAGLLPLLTSCTSVEDEEAEEGGEAVTGIDNALGLALSYDADTGTVLATLRDSLEAGQQLRVRVRRGMPQLGDEEKLDCDSITEARPITGAGSRANAPVGKVVYRGPNVSKDLIDLIGIDDDHRFQTDPAWAAAKIQEIDRAGGPKALVEACIMRPGKAPVRLQTNLEQAWDVGESDKAALGTRSIHPLSPAGRTEQPLHSMEAYAEKCVEELGEIPFFKRIKRGSYETFDCRDFVGSNGRRRPETIAGVEGGLIPLTRDGQPVTKCDGAGPNGSKAPASYDCVDTCDKAEYLSMGCEPGPTVTHGENDQGTHWVLLCRMVQRGQEAGWTKTKRFGDIAMLGTNPKTGKTCFFQNTLGGGTDGEHVPHPADRTKSRTIWSAPKGYCAEQCHSADPIVQTPWISGAKRSDGTPIVPMMGLDRDFPISANDRPFYIVNMDAQGWGIPKQLISEEAAPCATCHRVGGNDWIRRFVNWTTGADATGGISGIDYWKKITPTGKQFENSHWMPMRLEGLNASTWPDSQWAKAVAHITRCQMTPTDPSCQWADIPRGEGNPPAP